MGPARLRREGRRWTAWTVAVVTVFVTPGLVLVALSPLTIPVALASFAHAWAIPWLQARRGARSAVPLVEAAATGPEHIALGFLGDLLGHAERDVLARSGFALQRGELGVWLVGTQGALLVRPGGRRVDCWCVKVATADGLPAGDRAAHLVLALREDERGFATVANLAFSGARWRVRRCLPDRARAALDAARALSRSVGSA
jgi:hypothetical protein